MASDVPALAWFLLSSLVPLALGVTALAAVALGDLEIRTDSAWALA